MDAPPSAARPTILPALAGAMAVSGLGYFATAPFIALYIVLAIALVGLGWAMVARAPLLRAPPFLGLYGALGLFALTLPFVWHGPDDLLGVVILLPLLAAPGVAAMLEQDRRWVSPQAIAILALIGVVAAVALGLNEFMTSNGERVGIGNNPIHYGGIGVILGYVALTGIGAGTSPWRFVFLLGPPAGAATAILSQSRGPLLAWLVVAVILLPLLIAWFWRHAAFWIVAIAASCGATAIYFSGAAGRAASVYAMLQGGNVPGVDPARSILYTAAWEQFQASPLFGHGYTQLMAVAGPRMVAFGQTGLEHLHSDLADLGVVAGLLGLLAYLCILAAPLSLLRHPLARADRALVLGCVMLPVAYAALGLTNAMFGILPQTVLYAMLLGFLTARARMLGGQRLEDGL